MPKFNGTRIQFVGDTHTGLEVGMWPKGYPLNKPVSLGPAQEFANEQLDIALERYQRPAKKRILVIMGDCVHGPGEDYLTEMETSDAKKQCDAFLHSVSPFAARSNDIYVIDDASGHHVDPSRFGNSYIASELGAFGLRAYIKMELEVNGLVIGLKHHGPTLGYMPHTRGNSVRAELRAMHYEALNKGKDAPDISVFAHWHQFFHETLSVGDPNNGHRILHAIYTPALCSADQRTLRNVRRLIMSDMGTIQIDVHPDGKWDLLTLYREFDGNIKRVKHG
jgi:hypothetical protein